MATKTTKKKTAPKRKAASKPKLVAFIAPRNPSLHLVIEPSQPGERQASGLHGAIKSGQAVQFRSGRFRTDNQALVKELRAHRLYGVPRGFEEE